MPTYEYRCRACAHQFEEFQSMTAKPLAKCPACGKRKLKRLIGTGAAVIFKGSGFYETDYRSDSYKKAEKAEKAERDGAKDGGASKDKKDAADRKPAEKAKAETSSETTGTSASDNANANTSSASKTKSE